MISLWNATLFLSGASFSKSYFNTQTIIRKTDTSSSN